MAISRVDIQKLDNLKIKMKVLVPSDHMENEMQKRLKDMTAKASIPGFRPGKVPLTVIRKRYGDAIRGEVISDVLRTTYQEAIEEQKLSPASPPTIEITNATEGKELEYEATFEVYPKIDLTTLEDVEIEDIKVDIKDEDIDSTIEKLRKQQATWNEVDRPAELGDRLLVDFDGLMEGKPFDGGSGKEATIELGSGAAIPGFEKGLIGATTKEPVHIQLTFPEDYYRQDLADKPAEITIYVRQILAPTLPDDALLLEKMTIEGDMEKLRKDIRENLQRDVQTYAKNHIKEQIVDKFLQLNRIDIPTTLIDAEAEKLYQQTAKNLSTKKGADSIPPPKEEFYEVAKDRVQLGLLFAEFIKSRNMQVDSAQVLQTLQQVAAPYKDPEAIIAWYRNNPEQLNQINMAVLEEQVINELIKQVKLVDKNLSHQEFLTQRKV